MKKRVFAWMLAAVLLMLTACSGKQEEKPFAKEGETVARFKIVDMLEGGAWVVDSGEGGSAGDISSLSLDKTELYDEEQNVITVEALKPGMVVEICWSGMIAESYPTQIHNVRALRVVERQDDLVGFYRQVLHDLWENDSDLNHDAAKLGFDFSGLTNLSEEEKTALAYLFSCDVRLGLQYVFGTWQELCEKGYIDRENLYWEDGVFLSLSVTGTGNGTFTFEAEKWRSGSGAIYFKDCEANRGPDGQWNYEMGSFAIA